MPSTIKPQAILCDRDGTLIEDEHFLRCPDRIRWIPGVLETLRELRQQEIKVLVLSNQSGVARGYFGIDIVEAINAKLQRDVEEASGAIAHFYYCPHHPQGQIVKYSYTCRCRKPASGMFLQAIRDYNLQPTQCWAIGDRLRDLEPALNLGMQAFLVKTGDGLQAFQDLSQSPYADRITVVSSLPEILSLLHS